MTTAPDFLTPYEGGVRLTIKAKPGCNKARAPRLVEIGENKTALEIAVNAPPEDGKANKAIANVIAKALDLRVAAIAIKAGQTGRLKVIEVNGDASSLAAKIRAWIE